MGSCGQDYIITQNFNTENHFIIYFNHCRENAGSECLGGLPPREYKSDDEVFHTFFSSGIRNLPKRYTISKHSGHPGSGITGSGNTGSGNTGSGITGSEKCDRVWKSQSLETPVDLRSIHTFGLDTFAKHGKTHLFGLAYSRQSTHFWVLYHIL